MAAVSNDPFWKKLTETYDLVSRHPETDITVEYGDTQARVYALIPKDESQDEPIVRIDISRVKARKVE